MYSDLMLKTWLQEHTLQAQAVKDGPAFYRNLEQALDIRRADQGLMTAKPRWDQSVVDWTTSDFLSLNRSGRIREAFLEEIARHENFVLSASGSRVQYGNYPYINEVEREISTFFGAETAFITHTGFHANVNAVAAVPLPGDAILYDELVHASTHEGMKLSVAAHKISFRHNDVDSLYDALISLRDSHSAFKLGTQSILICVESIYSMKGDVCPIKAFIDISKELFPLGNAQFLIDEAHSVGVLGPNGRGLISMLGLENEIAIRIHMCSKALASTGGIILCNKTIRRVLIHRATYVSTSGAPSFPMVASMRAGIHLLMNGETKKAQDDIQNIAKYFFGTLISNPIWEEAVDEGLLTCPNSDDWEARPFLTHIAPIFTRPGHEKYLFFHLLLCNMNAYNISPPIIPKGTALVRFVFHAHNTREEVDATVAAICDWAREMLDIEKGKFESTLPSAARHVYALQAAM
ncbi:hypothetical protein G7Y89_g5220 [Cudoniella acicularis]|uniref:Aminotransferase class I/classII large domain-containing protein n=1 Tax=Cudoniella acicularis TaxID=354080 RepID=A0A8H4RNP9_9HELO|nr:hypothetical protein G7Y89_g5220 [Cudoniella acicularis]